MTDLYLVWSNDHQAWWRPNRAGYTKYTQMAGLYSRSEAMAICHEARGGWRQGSPPPEIPVLAADVVEIAEGDLWEVTIYHRDARTVSVRAESEAAAVEVASEVAEDEGLELMGGMRVEKVKS